MNYTLSAASGQACKSYPSVWPSKHGFAGGAMGGMASCFQNKRPSFILPGRFKPCSVQNLGGKSYFASYRFLPCSQNSFIIYAIYFTSRDCPVFFIIDFSSSLFKSRITLLLFMPKIFSISFLVMALFFSKAKTFFSSSLRF